jgi:tetratricopeptide (TPR) repeat protein
MKKTVYFASVLICLIGLAGCAIPQKSQVYAPPTTLPAKKQTVDKGYAGDLEPQSPPLLDIQPDEPEYPQIIEEDIHATMPSMVFVNDRIFEYGRKLERWKELDSLSVKRQVDDKEAAEMINCFRNVQSVLNGYSDLRRKLLQAQQVSIAERISNAAIFELEKNDIAFLESSCGRMLTDSADQSVGWNQREEAADLPQLETLIDRHAENREYQEIVQVWQRFPVSQIGRVHLRTKIHYGNALMYLQKEEMAAEIYQQVVDQMSSSDEQATDLVSLRKKLADLHTATGNYTAAALQYKKISEDYQNIGRLEEWSKLQLSILDRSKESGPELREYSSLLRSYLGYVAEKDGYKLLWLAENFLAKYPYSPVASNVDVIKEKVQVAADRWFSAFLAEVDKLRAEKKFQEAQDLLKTLQPDIIGPEKQLALKGKNEELSLTDAVERETQRMALLQELQNQWNSGMLLAKSEKFDEAIAVFSKLQGTEFSAKANEKIMEVSLEAAKAERKKAAGMFTRFTKTADIESKKKLLLETHRLLTGILVKYPEVDIRAKVVGNIERVEQEMMAIDPKLLVLADQDGPETAKINSLDGGAFAPSATTLKNERVEEMQEEIPIE